MLKYNVLVTFYNWNCTLFRLFSIFFLTVFVLIANVCSTYAADTPITVEDTLGGALPYTVRETCSPDYMEALKGQAWAAGQREITQNNNIIARPDSVLALSCFDAWLNHLWYFGESNFPGNPVESGGYWVGGDWAAFVLISEGNTLADLMTRLLLGTLSTYMNNFPGLMIGNRAKFQTAVPAYSAIPSGLASSVSPSFFNGCKRMNNVWTRSKCYDFVTESPVYKASHSGLDHDGFYTFEQYETNGWDFRTEANFCPSMTAIGGYDWPSANILAGPDPGTVRAMDSYIHFLDMVDGTVCFSPIKLGVIVVKGDNTYIDAVCPNPGCHFTAPTSLAGSGSCSP